MPANNCGARPGMSARDQRLHLGQRPGPRPVLTVSIRKLMENRFSMLGSTALFAVRLLREAEEFVFDPAGEAGSEERRSVEEHVQVPVRRALDLDDAGDLERITVLAGFLGMETLDELIAYDQDNYCGQWNTFQDYAEHYAEDTALLGHMPENLAYYFDFTYRVPRDVAAYVRPLHRELQRWKRAHPRSALIADDSSGDRRWPPLKTSASSLVMMFTSMEPGWRCLSIHAARCGCWAASSAGLALRCGNGTRAGS